MESRKGKSLSVFVLGILVALCLTACGPDTQGESILGSAGDRSDGQGETPMGQEDKNQAGYLFEVNGIALGVDMDMNELAPMVGEAKSVFEAPSCAAQGTTYVYRYASFEIETYPDGTKNRIAYIILKDDTVATPEGIDLSGTRADIVKAYGEVFEESGNRMTYAKDGMKLNFIFSGEDIISIEYVSGTVG